MRLGAFVIHGNNADTLTACLESLLAVGDEIVAIDSNSSDGSADLVRSKGIRGVNLPWRGFGAARARAGAELRGCDYLLFIDADERLDDASIDVIRQWKRSNPSRARYRLTIRDWAELPGRRFLFRREHHVRIVRSDCASWEPRMIVHEALSRGDAEFLPGAFIEHRFATTLEARREKENRYAWLWAVRAYAEGKRAKWAAFQRPAHTLRNAFVKGALWRGGTDALALSWTVSRYHAMKYSYLKRIERGEFRDAVDALKSNQLERVFELARQIG